MRLHLLALPVLILTSSMAMAQEAPPGWEAGPAEDATMAEGRRFRCVGADCPPAALLCLHAEAPGGPGEGRTLRVKDMLRPKAFPWADFEGWLKSKVEELDPGLGRDDMLAAGRWTDDEPAALQRLGGRDFLSRRYGARRTGASLTVPVAMWITDNRLNTAFCIASPDTYALAQDRVESFFDAMNRSPATPDAEPAGNP